MATSPKRPGGPVALLAEMVQRNPQPALTARRSSNASAQHLADDDAVRAHREDEFFSFSTLGDRRSARAPGQTVSPDNVAYTGALPSADRQFWRRSSAGYVGATTSATSVRALRLAGLSRRRVGFRISCSTPIPVERPR
jgi:hypothetical protein